MRARIGQTVRAHDGDVVRFDATLPDGSTHVDLALFSRVNGFGFAPHVDTMQARHNTNGRPSFITPKVLRLHEQRAQGTIEVTADQSLEFCMMQDIDKRTDTLVKPEIFKNGKRSPNTIQRIFYAFRQLVGKWQRTLRGHNANYVRPHR